MTELKPRSARPENRVQVDMYDEDGEHIHIDIPKSEFMTRKRQLALRKWVEANMSASAEDMMVHVLELLGKKDAVKFLNTREVEVQQISELLRLYTGGKIDEDATAVEVASGESGASSTS